MHRDASTSDIIASPATKYGEECVNCGFDPQSVPVDDYILI